MNVAGLAAEVVRSRGRDRHAAALVLADLAEELGIDPSLGIPTGYEGHPLQYEVQRLTRAEHPMRPGRRETVVDRMLANDLVVPTDEVLMNVDKYRSEALFRQQKLRTSTPPDAGMLFTRFRVTLGTVERVLVQRRMVRPGTRFYVVGHGLYPKDGRGTSDLQVVRERDNEPILHLSPIPEQPWRAPFIHFYPPKRR